MSLRILVLVAMFVPFIAEAATPDAVSKATSGMMADCQANGGKPSLSAGYETTVDLNGDDQPDYILDGNHLTCTGAESFFCGSGGCLSQIFVSTPTGYRSAFSDNVYGFTIDRSTRPPTLRVSWHGFHCKRTGVEGCDQTLTWNGKDFVVAGTPARPPPAAKTALPVPSGPWAIRRQGTTAIAFVPAQGLLRELSFTCFRGRAYAAVILRTPQSFAVGLMTAMLAGQRVAIALQRQPDYPLTYAGQIDTTELPRLIMRAEGNLALSLNGAPLATLPLGAAGVSVRTALQPCFRF